MLLAAGTRGEAGHDHHAAADGDEELGSGREAHLADGDGVTGGAPFALESVE